MKLKKLYETVVDLGIKADPRGEKSVLKTLEKKKKAFKDIKKEDLPFFDQESLTNPYADTRILHGTGNEEIKSILMGIDMEVGEILLADRLTEKGEKIDLVISHHPEGKAFASFQDVMYMQAEIHNKFGVPINIAESLIDARMKEVERRVMPANHTRASDAARLLNIPFMCMHTPTDNMVTTYLQTLIDKKKPETVGEIIELLKGIPEYREAAMINAGPKIFLGAKERSSGKVFVDMTGGTSGAVDIYKNMANAGIGTIIGMHMGDDHRKVAEKNHINVIIAGHIASDNLGINLMFDELMKKNKLKVLECSGFFRHSRIDKSGK
ncbi:MAG: NGG1p interacting factor NIF3 [Nitrospira sp.]|nr:NGG1p interacting factor NIF3 [bacterium]MBL7048208.1 NGG1p interacting factor NIF3 [Nitrospira sp.]